MIKKYLAFLMIAATVFAAVEMFGQRPVSAEAAALPAGTFTEYCRVDLDDPNSNLNVRTWEGRVIGKLRHGTRVWVNEYSGEWARVSVKRGKRWSVVGWVDSSYLVCG